MQTRLAQTPLERAGAWQRRVLLGQLQANHLGAPSRMFASHAADLLDQLGIRDRGLIASTMVIVGHQPRFPFLLEPRHQATHGFHRNVKACGNLAGIDVLSPTLKKSYGGRERELRWAWEPP
jgi:hypothetical protein